MSKPVQVTEAALPIGPNSTGHARLARFKAMFAEWVAAYDHPLVRIGLGIFLVLLLFSVFGGFVYTKDPLAIQPDLLYSPPSWAAPMGTDNLGRDLMARMIHGGQATLEAGLLGSFVAMVIGLVYGMAAALGPSWLDKTLMRLLDALLAIPTLVLMIFFAAIIRLDTTGLIFLLGLVSWPGLARIIRNEALAYRERDYVLAARQFGASTFYIARTHLLRAMLPILVVNATFLVADIVLALAGLTFLGLGIQPPFASWGGLLNDGSQLVILGCWWLIVFPGAAIFAVILAMNMLGQGLLARLEGR
jgi:peptide/nickel transport system permease protein